jgi:aldehyde dehydrogenase
VAIEQHETQPGAEPAERRPYRPEGPYPLIINGSGILTSGDFPSIEPSTGRAWARVAEASPADVDAAVSAARGALPLWRDTGPARRQEALLLIADLIEERADTWERLLPTENGRPIREVRDGDVPSAAGIFRFFAGLSRSQWGLTIPTEDTHSHVYTIREPLGVIAAVIPWNSPLITSAQKVAPALAAGNTVVLKPSEFASPSVVEFGLAVQELLPPGVVNVITGFGSEVGSRLVSHPDVAKVSFTGGTATARKILAAAGEQLTPALMELGGKSAMIVCDDANLDAAIEDALLGIFFANGEVCFAAARMLVHAAIYEEFVDRFAAAASRVRVGDALDPVTQLGPLITAAHRERVLADVAGARDEDARIVVGGGVRTLGGELEGGFYVEPTVIEDPEGKTKIAAKEVFGPVAVVERWTQETDALARANATEYGLAAGVWTSSLSRAHRFARALEAGIVWVNKWFDTPAGAPMGGVKASGFGRELSAETLHEYSAPKTVNVGLSAERPSLWD